MRTNTDVSDAPPRRPLQGVLQIVCFNWPMYVIAGGMSVCAILVVAFAPLPSLVRLAIVLATTVGLFWTVASLVVSYWVYDASPLCRWAWVANALPAPPASWLNIHCGFDESTSSLRTLFPAGTGRALDIFDAAEMTEPSILRARQIGLRTNPGEPADYRRLPADDASNDAAFLMLAAHELRSPEARQQLFSELHRVVRPGGHVIVAEHLRDAANFIAFGPGFVHFHSRAAWLRTFRDSGLVVDRAFRVTPSVAVYVLRRPT